MHEESDTLNLLHEESDVAKETCLHEESDVPKRTCLHEDSDVPQNVTLKGTEENVSDDFRRLHFKPTLSLTEYVAEFKSSLKTLLKVPTVGTNYKKLVKP